MCCNEEDRFNHYAHKCQTSPVHQFALLMCLAIMWNSFLMSIGYPADYIVELVVELKTAAQLRDSQFIFPQRPWLDLYGINVRPVAPFGSASSKQFLDPALIHQVLPDELLFEICLCGFQ
ncbi:hypothetical protein MTR67_019549 [Solanum verrucosum]|uniref:Uncharacterized protein n=1 Tax=Solanum verrucosum TaxID=315347 RepID=A0AAF0QUG8_SOLVR|nr:hypothetical protein MTR67_019549 [Solanum verrucosum]